MNRTQSFDAIIQALEAAKHLSNVPGVSKSKITVVGVCEHKCDQCLFSKNRIVPKERVKEILDDCEKSDTHFICHKGTVSGGKYKNIVCAGFYKEKTSTALSFWKALKLINFINPKQLIDA